MQDTPVTVEEKARRARALLNDPLIIEAFEKVRTNQLDLIANSLSDQIERRERAYFVIQALEELKSELQDFMNDASIAQRS